MSGALDRVASPTGAVSERPMPAPLPAQVPGVNDRLLAYGVLAVMVVEDMDVAGYPPERFKVSVGGHPAQVLACDFDVQTGRRIIDTSVGQVVIPGAAERAAGAQVTVAGMAIPGA